MNKRAFTLAELLISLGIVGVLAAIAIPAVNNMRPDKNKAMYLKAYDALTSSVQKIAANSSIYMPLYSYNNKKYNVTNYPLVNQVTPLDTAFSSYSGNQNSDNQKLANILSDVLGGRNVQRTANEVDFTTRNGVKWAIENSVTQVVNGNNLSWITYVTVDVNGNGSPNTIYTNGMAIRPDRFRFAITPAGTVIPIDAYGQMYILDRKNLRKRKNEKELVENGIANGTYTDNTVNGNDSDFVIPISELEITEIPDEVTPPDNSEPPITPPNNSEPEVIPNPPTAPVTYYVGTISGQVWVIDHRLADQEVVGTRQNISYTFTKANKMTSKTECYQVIYDYFDRLAPYGTDYEYDLTDDLTAVR